MQMTHVLGATAVAVCLSTPGLASQASPASDPQAIFVPGDQVPLSEFVAGTASVPVTLHVRPAILSWLSTHSHPIEVAVHTGGTVTDVAPTSYDVVAGTVDYTPTVDADLVVVSDALLNDFPVVTHWNAALNDPGTGPRGGQQVGASDGIGLLDYDPVTGTFPPSSGSITNMNAAHADPVGGQYQYATDLLAVFSDGTETTPAKDGEPADADVPDYERYIAENWSLSAVSDLRAIWLSDHSREISGLPIAHRNHPKAFDPLSPPGEKLQVDLPTFQIVHCFIVDHDDPTIVGSESSLATYIVPPGWTPHPAARYPVLFNSFYDIHASTFATMGDIFLTELGELYALDDRQAVGILHNGGGAGACQTLHGSGITNVAKLFRHARGVLKVDDEEVVVSGGSRGGTSGLHFAFNPNTDAFTARYVIANNPQTYPGDALERFSNPTYRLVQSAAAGAAGYKESWKTTWVDPISGRTGSEQTAYNLMGTDDFALIDATIANGSSGFVAEALAKGTKVIMRLGTHDFSKSFLHMSQYMEALTVAGVPLRVEMGHRFGHGHTLGTQPDERELLNRVIDGTLTLATGTYHFRPESTQDELDFVGQAFTPAHAPVFLESPLFVSMGQAHTHTVTGPPGTDYEIWGAQIDETQWTNGVIVDISTPGAVFTGTLPTAAAGVEMTSAVHTFTAGYDPLDEGPWRLELRYRLPGTVTWVTLNGESSTPADSYDPVVAGLAALYDVEPVSYLFDLGAPGEVMGLDVDSRTGGLNEDLDL